MREAAAAAEEVSGLGHFCHAMPGMADDGRGQRRERTDADVGEEKKKMDQLRVGADISKTWLVDLRCAESEPCSEIGRRNIHKGISILHRR